MAAIIIAAANTLIADACPLIALARVNGLSWLEALFGQVLVTEEVMAEVLSGGYPAREEPIQAAIASGWLRAVAVDSSEPALPDLEAWIQRVISDPLEERQQPDGRYALWGLVAEAQNRALRVITLEVRETVYNAFFDRGFLRAMTRSPNPPPPAAPPSR